MGIVRTDDMWRWSRWCRDTYKFHKNPSEPMWIVWKQIGDRLGGIYRSTKKSSTISPGQASTTLTRTQLDQSRPPRVDLTLSTNSSISLRHRILHLLKTRSNTSSNNSSCNSGKNSLWTRLPKAADEAIGHSYQSKPTPPVAPNPPKRHQPAKGNQAAEDNYQAYHQHHESQWKS